jgi:hypothetical protein
MNYTVDRAVESASTRHGELVYRLVVAIDIEGHE